MKHWDVFISHAGPDKRDFVTPLAEELRRRNVEVWLDEWTIELGESISASISEGLQYSKFGIVVLSPAYFERAWPKREIATLFALEDQKAGYIIPIWYHIEHGHVLQHAPLLADRMAAKSEEGIPRICDRILRHLDRKRDATSGLTPESVRALTKRLFPDLAIDEFWQAQLMADLDVRFYRTTDDIELAWRRARKAVEAYSQDKPVFFRSGTDRLTKALGFVDLCFRSRHHFARETRQAFDKYAKWVEWDVTGVS